MGGLTNFPGGISSFGIPVLGGGTVPPFNGTYFFVKPSTGSDGNTGKSPAKALKTLAKALSLATANKNDVVFLIAESNTAASTTDYQSTALDWNKDAVHLIGINSGPMMGQRSRIAQTATVLTIEDLFTVSANNCLIANIEIFHGVDGSTATSPRAMVVSGMRNYIYNCQISGMGDGTGANSMDTTGARSLTVSGSENFFKNCYIGLDTTLRGTNKIEVGITGTASVKATRNIFDGCFFNTWNSNTDSVLLACSYVDRFVLFKDCTFSAVQGIASAAVPTGGISTANMNGCVYIQGGAFFGVADPTTADNTSVYILSYGSGSTAHVDIGVAKTTDVT